MSAIAALIGFEDPVPGKVPRRNKNIRIPAIFLNLCRFQTISGKCFKTLHDQRRQDSRVTKTHGHRQLRCLYFADFLMGFIPVAAHTHAHHQRNFELCRAGHELGDFVF